MAKARKQKLGPIDKLVLALLRKDVPLILGWDGKRGVYLVAALCDEDSDDEPPFDQPDWIEYQVSDGLPGDRFSSSNYYSFEEAQRGFDEACQEPQQRKMG